MEKLKFDRVMKLRLLELPSTDDPGAVLDSFQRQAEQERALARDALNRADWMEQYGTGRRGGFKPETIRAERGRIGGHVVMADCYAAVADALAERLQDDFEQQQEATR